MKTKRPEPQAGQVVLLWRFRHEWRDGSNHDRHWKFYHTATKSDAGTFMEKKAPHDTMFEFRVTEGQQRQRNSVAEKACPVSTQSLVSPTCQQKPEQCPAQNVAGPAESLTRKQQEKGFETAANSYIKACEMLQTVCESQRCTSATLSEADATGTKP